MDMERAPKFFVIAALQELPKNPIDENSTIAEILRAALQVLSSRGTLDCCSAYVPGDAIQISPSRKSPLDQAAAVMATNEMEYMRKINSS